MLYDELMKENSIEEKREEPVSVFNRLNERAAIKQRKRKRMMIIFRTLIACAIVTLIAVVAVSITYLKQGSSDEQPVVEVTYITPEVTELVIPDKVETVSENKVNEEKTEPEECFEANMKSISKTPTSIALEWDDADLSGYSIFYRPVEAEGEKHGKANREDNSASMSSICTAINEANDSGEEKESNGWVKINVKNSNVTLDGLEPNTTYHVHVVYEDRSLGEYSEVFDVTTTKSGYCDPFRNVYSLMRISERDEATGAVLNVGSTSSVQMTTKTGCDGVIVKPMLNVDVYNFAARDERRNLGTIQKGTKLIITPDEGNNYCYYDGGSYKLHIISEDRQFDGWIDARSVLIDMNKIFTVDVPSSMQFDRTNAYSSIFTAGGDAQNVELEPVVAEDSVNPETGEILPGAQWNSSENLVVPEGMYNPEDGTLYQYTDTRYKPLMVNGDLPTYMNTKGYNNIDGVTGNQLKNYESKDYMPVIWDLAMELKQCQKNALENGYTIKMYEGYRPLSTSQLVYNSLNGIGVLAVPLNNTTLAQGYITSQAYNVGHYIGYRSRHNRGVATDLTIVRLNNDPELMEEAHMQTKMHTLDFRCNMAYNTWEADLLTDIMIGHDSHLEYLGLRQEWWHFQLRNSRTDLYPLIDAYGYEDFEF